MKNTYLKLDPYIFNDKYKLFEKMEKLCCKRLDCHTHSMSYYIKTPHIINISLFHKGSYIYQLRYDYRKKNISINCNCEYKTIENFIAEYKPYIKYFFIKEVKPILTALFENDKWVGKKQLLNKVLYPDVTNIIKEYLCLFNNCKRCNKEISGKYQMCYDCNYNMF